MYPYDAHLNIPSIMAEYVLPIVAILLGAAILLGILWKLGWMTTTRDAMLALFTGFILVYLALTIIGAAFRGRGQQLVPFWKVPNLEHDPGVQRQVPPDWDGQRYALIDTRTGDHA
jgi:menaquinol-cytochrome c reductase cytochrome b/c subunit